MNVNLFERKIELTKAEAKAAGKPNSAEYTELLELMKDFPDYSTKIMKPSVKKVERFKGLDYPYMENYIKNHNDELLKDFYELRGLDKDGKRVGMAATASYGEIKLWFLAQFPEIESMAENVNKMIEDARKLRESRKTA